MEEFINQLLQPLDEIIEKIKRKEELKESEIKFLLTIKNIMQKRRNKNDK